MAGTKEGGRKAALKNLQNNPNFYSELGRRGGSVKGTARGFASQLVGEDGLTGPERARVVGVNGGRVSKRGKSQNRQS